MPGSPHRKESSWIAGTLWQREELKLLLEDTTTGRVHLGTCAHMSPAIHVAGTVSRKITIEMENLVPSSTSLYLLSVARPDLPDDGQTTFEIWNDGLLYLFPAQILIFAIFGDAWLREVLLTPAGLWQPSVLHRSKYVEGKSNELANFFAWALCSQSAVACWRSVFALSVGAPLTLRPPRMKAELGLLGIEQDGVFAVTRARVLTFETDEHFNPWMKRKPPTVYTRTLRIGKSGRERIASRLISRMDGLRCEKLTDAQWAELRSLFNHGKRWLRADDRTLREYADLIIRKYSLPCSWRSLASEGKSRTGAQDTYEQLVARGAWLGFIEKVKQLQGRNPPP